MFIQGCLAEVREGSPSRKGVENVEWMQKKPMKTVNDLNAEMNLMLSVFIVKNEKSVEIKIMLTMFVKKNCVI